MGTEYSKLKVLVVDDAESIRLTTQRHLEHVGCEVVMAEDGEEAFVLFEQQSFDLVITDWRMPRMSGPQLISRIRKTGSRLPIILMSGLVDTDNGKPMFGGDERPDSFLEKPFSPEQLDNAIETVLAGSREGIVTLPPPREVLFIRESKPNIDPSPTLKKIDVGSKNDLKLLAAVEQGQVVEVQLLLKSGANPLYYSPRDQGSIAGMAAQYGQLEILKTLASHAPNLLSVAGKESMLTAVGFSRVEIVKYLISNGISVDIANEHGDPIMYYPVSKNEIELVEILFKAGANPNAIDKRGRSLFFLAVSDANLEITKLFVEFGADPSKPDLQTGRSVLLSAVEKPDTMKFLLEHGALVNQEALVERDAALAHAAGWGCSECVELLIKAGAHLNHQDINGMTALMEAAKHGRLANVQVLVAAGADLLLQDKNGLTALDWTQHDPNVKYQESSEGQELLEVSIGLGLGTPDEMNAKLEIRKLLENPRHRKVS